MQHNFDAHARGITLHYERLSEDWELKRRRRHKRRLECAEHGIGFRPPVERVFVKWSRERSRDVTVAFNKTPIVVGEPQERVHCLDRA
jgi:hypothetical protein